jgi:hypothetical protein
MPVCPAAPRDAMPAADQAGLELLGQASIVAVRAADLRSPAQAGLGKDGRTALTAAGAGPIRTGDVAVFLKPVAVAKAVVRRDGRVQAAGHPADHARLGLAEQRLDELTGTPGAWPSPSGWLPPTLPTPHGSETRPSAETGWAMWSRGRGLARAGEHYRASLAIREWLAAADPANAEWQRNLFALRGKVRRSRAADAEAWDAR